MKQVQNITCWTDYPFVELGDEPYKQAPIRRVSVLSYDGDKYAKVSFQNCGDCLEVKAGYLYSQAGRCGQVKTVNRRKLERMVSKATKEQPRPKTAKMRCLPNAITRT